ncbi:MAG: glycosyltransferase family 9 protein [Alphaproteobacteria bacterium]|nr:glycosyltransferase family 9 protein [Alphaproteobacteria bacterium]
MNPTIPLPPRPRILVVSLRRIGDVLLTTPLIRSLHRAYPGATIDALVFAGTAGVLKGNPDIARVIAMPARPNPIESAMLAARLFKRYDLAVSTQPGDRPTAFALLAGRNHAGLTDDTQGIGRTLKRWMLHAGTPLVPDIHRVEQMLRLADALGIARVPEVVCPAAGPADGIAPGGDYAVIHAAPMFRYKQWTAEGWRALAAGLQRRGLAVVAISGPDPAERAYLDEVWHGVTTVNPAAWPATVTLLSRARLYVGPDTSVTHLAAAAGCPTVALFGPMDPRAWGPWPAGGLDVPWQISGTIQNRGNVWVVQNPLPCMPCLFEGCERNISSNSICLDELSAERVLLAADQALAKATGAAAS